MEKRSMNFNGMIARIGYENRLAYEIVGALECAENFPPIPADPEWLAKQPAIGEQEAERYSPREIAYEARNRAYWACGGDQSNAELRTWNRILASHLDRS